MKKKSVDLDQDVSDIQDVSVPTKIEVEDIQIPSK